jgi:uncharacterized membrane protein YfcA
VETLLLLLLFIFAGVALMVVLGERFAKPMEPEKMQRVSRWILPLVGVALVLSALRFYFWQD